MKTYTFWIPIEGDGDNAEEGWASAIERLTDAALRGEYDNPPEDVFKQGESIPAAEILGGSLRAGFGYEEGEPEEINPHGMPED